MAKKKKPKKTPSIVFDMEKDAEELFRRSLEEFDRKGLKPGDKTMEDEGTSVQPKPKTGRVEAPGSQVLDLHQCTLQEACRRVDQFFGELLRDTRGKVTVIVITGKGRHSPQGEAVLPREVHSYVLERYRDHIVTIEESPADVALDGLPVRGHFHVTLQGGS